MVALFPQASLLLPAGTAADSETGCFYTHPSVLPKRSAFDFAVKTFYCSLEQPSGMIAT